MTDIAIWSPIDDDNNSAPPAGWPEGMNASGVNNAARAMQGAIARFYERLNPTDVVTGSANDIILTYTVPPVLQDGDIFAFLPHAANTGPVTLSVGTGAIPLFLGTEPLRGGELQPAVLMFATWQADGHFYLSSPAGGPTVSGLALISAGGTANALSLTYASGGPTALVAGDRFTVGLSATNTGPATLTVQGIGPNAIVAGGSPLTGGEMRVSTVVDFVWDGLNFHLLDPALVGAFMPLGGGTFTGPITAPTITAIGTITAQQFTTAGNVNATGTVTGGAFNTAGNINGNVLTGNALNSNGNIGAAGNLTVTGAMTCGGACTATSFVDSNGLLLLDVIEELQARVAALEARA